MADHLVDARADAHRESAVAQASRCGTMVGTVLAAYLVNLEGGHSGMDFLLDGIKNTRIDHSGTADALDLLGGLDQVTSGHDGSFSLHVHDASVKLSGSPFRDIM